MENQTKSEVVVFPSMEEDQEQIFFREEEENDLSCWEVINSSDSENDDVLSLSDASWHSSLSSSPKDSLIPDLIQDVDDHHYHHDYEPFHDGYGEPYKGDQEEDACDGYNDVDEEEEEEDYDEDDGCDLDDELVPRALSGKLGRQRMRKLGKRTFAKMHTSKRSPFLFVKPGCVHGKHGLGLKHSF
ncbi:hypothetical protein DITRI_Ditri01bG0045600 [Diplodiscus trichospermus]